MKKKRPHWQLNDEQQLALGLILVILVALSLLYCLGFASLALRQAWQAINPPWTTPETGEEILDATPQGVPSMTPEGEATATPKGQPTAMPEGVPSVTPEGQPTASPPAP